MRFERRLSRLVGAAGLAVSALGTAGIAASAMVIQAGPAGASPTCVTAGTTGLTAAVDATSSETIAGGNVVATGCDIGIYVGPGVMNVTIGGPSASNAVTISGANDTGIFAEQTSFVTIEGATIQNNGVQPNHAIVAFGGVVLAGVDASAITGNTIINNGGGGVFVDDNGPTDPGALNAGPSQPVPAVNDTVTNNTISGNFGNCGVVLSTHNAGGSINDMTVSGNTVTGHIGAFQATGPDLGGIVVATAAPDSLAFNVQVTNNTVSDSYEGGIILHSHAPHDTVTDVSITGNTVGPANNWGSTNGPPTTAGIILGVDALPPALAPTIEDLTVASNSISGQYYGVWISGISGTTLTPANTISVLPGGTAIYTTPPPASGYWQAASDGGVFNYGTAGFYGSAGSLKLNKPVVGITQTQDQGGYWLVASDGGIFNYGDAPFFGSAGSLKLNAPVVGMASTPYVPNPTGAPASPAGLGYWLVASDGGVFNYGDAGFFGSAGGLKLNKPIVGMAPIPDGKGYWLVASDGGVFNYGDAGFYSSAASLKLNAPIVGIAATPDGKGYWLVASDGGIFNYGDAGFFGSAGNLTLNKPVVGISGTPDGGGYWLTASDGGVFNYGDAGFFGSAGNIKLNQPVVGVASVGVTTSG
ncbi:MAG TPA: right-handed parallel beta-helix repeat-containing protein [Acidimicrobiales bacterium]|jgi:hypothetical protein